MKTMKKNILIALASVCLAVAVAPRASQAFTIVTKDMLEKQVVVKTDLIPTVDNFIVLFDTSATTNEMVPGTDVSKIKAAKTLLAERNQWLPDLGYNAGLYIYTHADTLMGTFKEVYGIKPYDRAAFAAAIDKLPEKGQGPAMLQAGLHGLRKVMAGLSGRTAVIIFTDGKFTVQRGIKKPLQIAQEIAREHDVDFYLISSATMDADKQLLAAVSKVSAGSRVVPLATFLDNPLYLSGALFIVKTTAYARLKPVTKVVGAVADPILFDFNSAELRPEYDEKKTMLVDFLQKNPNAYVVTAGFTDSAGSEEYNLGLSQRRAESVKRALTDAGIDGDRIVTLWYGELDPIADNATEEGRQQNRRVEMAIGGIN
jgi:OmpA-OmpF porin, OOP family